MGFLKTELTESNIKTETGDSKLTIGTVDDMRLMNQHYKFYLQDLDGRNDVFDEMLRKLEPSEDRPFVGVIFRDNTVVWTNKSVVHRLLAEAAGKGDEYDNKAGQFDVIYRPGDEKPQLHAYMYSEDEASKESFRAFLNRNIKQDTPVEVFTQPVLGSSGPTRLDIRDAVVAEPKKF